MLVELEARVLQAQAELLPLESVEVPGSGVAVAVDHAALALTTETQAGPLQHTGLSPDNYKDKEKLRNFQISPPLFYLSEIEITRKTSEKFFINKILREDGRLCIVVLIRRNAGDVFPLLIL